LRKFINVCTGAFSGAGKLRSLDLTNNRLSILDGGTFDGVGDLEQLYVGGNRLVDVVPRALAPFARSLTHLDLSDNRIRTIDFQAVIFYFSKTNY